MSVPDQPTVFVYTGNGVTTTFAYGFYLLSQEDIVVSINGVVQTTGFTVNGIGSQSGGAVIFGVAPASGASIAILRQVAIERDTDYQRNGDLRAQTLNLDFDRLWMALQENQRDKRSSLRYPIVENLDGELPSAGNRALTVLAFDALGVRSLMPMPSSLGAGDLRIQEFVANTDFTPNVTTTLTLDRIPLSKANCWVYWDGVPQLDFTIAGDQLTFPTPIYSGIAKVYVRTGTTLSLNIPATGSVADDKVANGSKLKNRIENYADPIDHGADPTGVADSSAAFAAALATGKKVDARFGIYMLKNVEIGTNQTILGDGAVFKAAPGANYIFKLKGFRPVLIGGYFDDQLDRITHGIGTNAAVIVEDATYPVVDRCWFVNVYSGLLLKVSAINTTNQVTKGQFSHLRFDTVIARGIFVGPNVNTCTFEDVRAYVGTLPSGGLEKPRTGCIGFQIVSTGSMLAAGGHMLHHIDVEQAETGFQFTDAELSHINDCFADSLSGNGFEVTGASSHLKFSDCLAGTCLRGFSVSNTSNNIYIDGPQTIFQGVVPPWGDPAAFFNAGSPFDISVDNTAQVVVGGSWFGDHKIFAASTAVLTFENSTTLSSANAGISAGTTTYFGASGTSAADVAGWIPTKSGIITGIRAQSNAAPGGAETFTYTVRKEFADTAIGGVITGGNFELINRGYVAFDAGDHLSVRLVTSGAAAATAHRLSVEVQYFN